MQPIYTADNTNAAYQLNWSLSLFGLQPLPIIEQWLAELKTATVADGVRVLSAELRSANVAQFFVSTRPEISPSDVVRSVKSRLQYLLRKDLPKAFRRNYHIQSVGEAKSEVLDRYVAKQTEKHPMADPRVQSLLAGLQFYDQTVELDRPQIGTYGQYLNSIQIVLENDGGWHEVGEEHLNGVRNMIIAAAKKKDWRLSRIGLLSNHLHILVGAEVNESPQSVALSLMNNIAYVHSMTPVLKFSYYAGTFGGYDRGAIRLNQSKLS
ncbi:MAG: transposase [Planctomycetaceae bacterium]|nr:transposase [Planctomycetaceae bacterium]